MDRRHILERDRADVEQMVTLVGGPADGETMRWSGGDVFEHIALQPVGPVLVANGRMAPVNFAPSRFYYRRSMVTPTIFVFQP